MLWHVAAPGTPSSERRLDDGALVLRRAPRRAHPARAHKINKQAAIESGMGDSSARLISQPIDYASHARETQTHNRILAQSNAATHATRARAMFHYSEEPPNTHIKTSRRPAKQNKYLHVLVARAVRAKDCFTHVSIRARPHTCYMIFNLRF